MDRKGSCSHRDSRLPYIPPKLEVVALEISQSLHVGSNEGLGYEDLFAAPESVLYEEPFRVLL